jgi:hypothetical protein
LQHAFEQSRRTCGRPRLTRALRAGSFERGQPHYYRVQGGAFVLEYDNTQNEANHVHSLWRDLDRDFRAALLGEHYKAAPRGWRW